MTSSPASSHTQEEQRVPKNNKYSPVSSRLVPIRRATKRLEELAHDLHHWAIVRRRDQWWEALKTKKCRTLKPSKDNNIRQNY